MMWGYGANMGWVMWLIMGTGVVAFWVLVVLLIRAILPGRDRGVEARPTVDPKSLLKERLARGEITPEEYETRRKLIDQP